MSPGAGLSDELSLVVPGLMEEMVTERAIVAGEEKLSITHDDELGPSKFDECFKGPKKVVLIPKLIEWNDHQFTFWGEATTSTQQTIENKACVVIPVLECKLHEGAQPYWSFGSLRCECHPWLGGWFLGSLGVFVHSIFRREEKTNENGRARFQRCGVSTTGAV